jgi:hypothetical protein
MSILRVLFGDKTPNPIVVDWEERNFNKLVSYHVALQTLSSLQSQFDIVLRSHPGYVTLELTDHWGMFVGTALDAHVILEGKRSPDEMVDLITRASQWATGKNQEFTDWMERKH